MLVKKITDNEFTKNHLQFQNNSEGFHVSVTSIEDNKENYIRITDIDSLIALKNDIEEQLKFQLSLINNK